MARVFPNTTAAPFTWVPIASFTAFIPANSMVFDINRLADIGADFIDGLNPCCLFTGLRYSSLNPTAPVYRNFVITVTHTFLTKDQSVP